MTQRKTEATIQAALKKSKNGKMIWDKIITQRPANMSPGAVIQEETSYGNRIW